MISLLLIWWLFASSFLKWRQKYLKKNIKLSVCMTLCKYVDKPVFFNNKNIPGWQLEIWLSEWTCILSKALFSLIFCSARLYNLCTIYRNQDSVYRFSFYSRIFVPNGLLCLGTCRFRSIYLSTGFNSAHNCWSLHGI